MKLVGNTARSISEIYYFCYLPFKLSKKELSALLPRRVYEIVKGEQDHISLRNLLIMVLPNDSQCIFKKTEAARQKPLSIYSLCILCGLKRSYNFHLKQEVTKLPLSHILIFRILTYSLINVAKKKTLCPLQNLNDESDTY